MFFQIGLISKRFIAFVASIQIPINVCSHMFESVAGLRKPSITIFALECCKEKKNQNLDLL